MLGSTLVQSIHGYTAPHSSEEKKEKENQEIMDPKKSPNKSSKIQKARKAPTGAGASRPEPFSAFACCRAALLMAWDIHAIMTWANHV